MSEEKPQPRFKFGEVVKTRDGKEFTITQIIYDVVDFKYSTYGLDYYEEHELTLVKQKQIITLYEHVRMVESNIHIAHDLIWAREEVLSSPWKRTTTPPKIVEVADDQ